MKRMLVLLGTIMMIMGISMTAEAKTQNDKYEEMATYLKAEFDKEVEEGFKEDFGELLEDRSLEEICTTEMEKVDEGFYKYILTCKFDETGRDELVGVMLIDFFDCDTIEDVEDCNYDDFEYFKFNGRRVDDDFVSAYLKTYETKKSNEE